MRAIIAQKASALGPMAAGRNGRTDSLSRAGVLFRGTFFGRGSFRGRFGARAFFKPATLAQVGRDQSLSASTRTASAQAHHHREGRRLGGIDAERGRRGGPSFVVSMEAKEHDRERPVP